MNRRGKDWFGIRGVQWTAAGAVLCCAGSLLRAGEAIVFPNGNPAPAASALAFQPGEPIRFPWLNTPTAVPGETKFDEERLSTAENASLRGAFDAPSSRPAARGSRTARPQRSRKNEWKDWLSNDGNESGVSDKDFGIRDSSLDSIEKKGFNQGLVLGNLTKPKGSSQAQAPNAGKESWGPDEGNARSSELGPLLGAHQDGALDLRQLLTPGGAGGGGPLDKPDISLREFFSGPEIARPRESLAKPTETPAGPADSISSLGPLTVNPLPTAPEPTLKGPAPDPFFPRGDLGRIGTLPSSQPRQPSVYSPGISGSGFSSLPDPPRRVGPAMDARPTEPRRRFPY